MSDIDSKIDALITGIDQLRSEMAEIKQEMRSDIGRLEERIDEISEKLRTPEEEGGTFL